MGALGPWRRCGLLCFAADVLLHVLCMLLHDLVWLLRVAAQGLVTGKAAFRPQLPPHALAAWVTVWQVILTPAGLSHRLGDGVQRSCSRSTVSFHCPDPS